MVSDRPIAVQFSDLRGFSSFTAQHGDEKAYRISREFTEIVEQNASQFEGRLLKTYGDGVMTSFEDPAQAIRSSVSMQEDLCRKYCRSGAPEISAGIGLSWGTAIRTEDDLFGHSVNLAKRLSDEAKGGQVLASSSVIDAAQAVKEYTFRDMGSQTLKGLGEHRIFEVIWRPEVARIETADHRMDIILTDDDKVVVELSKTVQQALQDAAHRLESEADTAGGGWLERVLKQQIAKRLATSMPAWVQWAQARSGLGIEHSIHDVDARIVNGGLKITLGAKQKRLSFSAAEIDPGAARAFVEQLEQRKRDSI